MGRSFQADDSGSSGFSLIEVLIAVVVLSVGIVLILQAMHGSLAAWDGGVERMRSAMLAQETLEAWRLALRERTEVPVDNRGSFTAPYSDYRWQVERVMLPLAGGESEPGELQELLCTVWRQGHDRSFRLATRIYQPASEEAEP